jgi:hypothetical protein
MAMAKKDVANVDQAAAGAVDVQEVAERLPMPVPEGGWPADEFTGLPGCFVRDPYTGVRSRAPADDGAAQ